MTSVELEHEIAEWRAFVGRGSAFEGLDVEELEVHLRDQIADLHHAGLADDEAFLVAVKRMGSVDDLSREFAREHSGRLWKQLVLGNGPVGHHGEEAPVSRHWPEAVVFAIGAAATVQGARLVAHFPEDLPSWFARNASVHVLPWLAVWFARRRGMTVRQLTPLLLATIALLAASNAYPYQRDAATDTLVALHLPVALWFAMSFCYMAGTAGDHGRRMDVVRFTGEWCIYYALIALGGGLLVALTAAVLEPSGINPERVVEWVLPSGVAGAVLIAAWLVESKQQVIENMAPVLTMVFTPLFAAMLAVAAVAYAVSGLGEAFDRELLGVLDALMIAVLGLVLYGLSAREPSTTPRWMDRIQLAAVVSALLLDAMVLATMASRIGGLGFTANRFAALGLNVLLLANLARSARLSVQFLGGRTTFHALERWQTTFLPAFGAWAVVVVVLLPPAFGFR